MAKKLTVLLVVCAMLVASFAGCTAAPAASVAPSASAPAVAAIPLGKGELVGVAMPTKSLQRWNQDGANVYAALANAGYSVDLQFADNTQNTQNSQIENMITEGCKVLIISSIDGAACGGILSEAKAANIPVIAYDRLIMNTDAVSYYATFDNLGVGKMQGDYIVSALGLDKGAKGPFSMEVFGGDPGDNNAKLFNQGAMMEIQKYIDSGVLVIKSGQTKFPDQIAITSWDSKNAQDRMDNLLTSYYADSNIDVVLSPNDSLAQGIVASLKSAGYGTGSKKFPVLTGQDCDVINVGQIIAGTQSMSIFKDTRILANEAAMMAGQIIAGQKVDTNTTYNNGTMDVPSFNCKIQFCDKTNWKAVLVDSGYYRLAQIPGAQ